MSDRQDEALEAFIAIVFLTLFFIWMMVIVVNQMGAEYGYRSFLATGNFNGGAIMLNESLFGEEFWFILIMSLFLPVGIIGWAADFRWKK